jgi:hypothetical protein
MAGKGYTAPHTALLWHITYISTSTLIPVSDIYLTLDNAIHEADFLYASHFTIPRKMNGFLGTAG